MKSWKTRLSVVLAMMAMVLVASVPAVADSVDVDHRPTRMRRIIFSRRRRLSRICLSKV